MSLAVRQTMIFEMGIDTLLQRFDDLGLTTHIEADLRGLSRFLRVQDSFVNPTYDPERSDLGAEDFWLRVTDHRGQTVACSGERTLRTDDFHAMVAAGTIWFRGGFPDIDGPATIPTLPTGPKLAGKIGASGSTYTLPEWRRNGLALLMTWLTRMISFRDFGTMYNTGFVRESLAVTTVPKLSYGYDHVEKIIDGYFPPQRGPEQLYLCWIDRGGMARRVLDLPTHPTNPLPLVAERPVKRVEMALAA